MKKRVIQISFSLLMTLPAALLAAEKASQPVAGDQRAACDAQCRENFQNNSAAMQACLRDCGAVGPASPAGAMAISHEAANTTQQDAKVKGSKSNSSERQVSPPAPPPGPAETSNLNLSKSNINRVATPPPEPLEGTTVKGSKSNSDNRMAQPSGAGAPDEKTTTVTSSKSNSSDRQVAPDTDEMPPVEPEGSPPEDG